MRSPEAPSRGKDKGKQIPETPASEEAEGSSPEPQWPGPDAARPLLKLRVTPRWQHNDQEQGRGGKRDGGRRLAGDGTWAVWRKVAARAGYGPEWRDCEQGLARVLGKARG